MFNLQLASILNSEYATKANILNIPSEKLKLWQNRDGFVHLKDEQFKHIL